MNISVAVIAPFFLPIPPKKHGGTEWVAYHQANGLVDLGYDVTLFAIAGSQTKATLYEVAPVGVADYAIDPSQMESSRPLRLEATLLALTADYINNHVTDFDIVFAHARGSEYLVPLANHWPMPVAHVLHLPLFAESAELYKRNNTPLVPIAEHQKHVFTGLRFTQTVYNGVDTEVFVPVTRPTLDYALMITTIGEHKNTLAGIEACAKAGIRLIIAGKIRDMEYFEKKIKPHIDGHQVVYIGEIGLKKKIALFQHAKVFLMPVNWAEPFGLVMIEAMACGTPVIGFDHGAVREVVADGKTGFVVDTVSAMATAIQNTSQITRAACRSRVSSLFSTTVMAQKYSEVIQSLVKI